MVRRRGDPEGLRPLAYEAWLLRFEGLAISHMKASIPTPETASILQSGDVGDARDLVLSDLEPATLFKGPADPVENPRIPAAIAQVDAEEQAAGLLFTRLFLALFRPEAGARAYAAPTAYDHDGLQELLAPYSVIVLAEAGRQATTKVIHEGEWLLEDLTAVTDIGLRDVYHRLVHALGKTLLAQDNMQTPENTDERPR